MALAILVCGLVVPTVPNLLCWLKCSIAYGAIYHIMVGIIRDNLSHITHMPSLPITKLICPPRLSVGMPLPVVADGCAGSWTSCISMSMKMWCQLLPSVLTGEAMYWSPHIRMARLKSSYVSTRCTYFGKWKPVVAFISFANSSSRMCDLDSDMNAPR